MEGTEKPLTGEGERDCARGVAREGARTVTVLEPHGFCAGVKGALALAKAHPKAWCLHELVHNGQVVGELRSGGMKFVESVDEVPEGETIVFSAHGVSPAVRREAQARNLKIVDATCPFVAKVHRDARSFAAAGLPVVVIGHPNHAEVIGIVGEVEGKAYIYPDLPPKGAKIGVVSQTTMNADDVAATIESLKADYEVVTSAQVCHATKERQDAVKNFRGDALIVLGGANSSNTRRLAEVAACPAFRVGTIEELRALDLGGAKAIGVTAGASTPEEFLREALENIL